MIDTNILISMVITAAVIFTANVIIAKWKIKNKCGQMESQDECNCEDCDFQGCHKKEF